MSEHLFTSESITEGHPDKVCDQIADAVVDDILSHDPAARVACEVIANGSLALIFGEITTSHKPDYDKLARDVIRRIGYTGSGFSAEGCAVLLGVKEQSPNIGDAVSVSLEARGGSSDELDAVGAGDQGMMFGFACTESEPFDPGSYMPLAIHLAHRLSQRLADVRRRGVMPLLCPDGKTQVTLAYDGVVPQSVHTVLISTQHVAGADQGQLRAGLLEHVVEPVLPRALCPGGDVGAVNFLSNPSGRFEIGGPQADSGLTGRKLIADTYGGAARHGGGAQCGKDPSKVDRSGSYYARYAAKNLVAAGVAERLEVQVSYAIGQARPVSITVDTFGTGRVDEARIGALLLAGEVFDFRPGAIIRNLSLLDTRFSPVACYGHFGRTDVAMPWEQLDKVAAVQDALGVKAEAEG
jgi:S-adenosylmethionine synthetase